MKSFLLLLLSVALSHQITPIPLPNLTLSDFQGSWYVVWLYNSDFLNNLPNITCGIYDISILPNDQGGSLHELVYESGQNVVDNTVEFKVSKQNSVWKFSGGAGYDWVGYDYVSGNWAVAASPYEQVAIIISKYPNVSNLVIASQSIILKKEGYSTNSSNTVIVPNTNCPSFI